MKYSVRYVHKIAPSPKDVGHNIEMLGQDLADRVRDRDLTGLAAILRNMEVMISGCRIREARVEDGKIIVFPVCPGLSTYWHSIILTPII
jgi:hypothetical protein